MAGSDLSHRAPLKEPPLTAGRLAEAFARLPADTPVRVSRGGVMEGVTLTKMVEGRFVLYITRGGQ